MHWDHVVMSCCVWSDQRICCGAVCVAFSKCFLSLQLTCTWSKIVATHYYSSDCLYHNPVEEIVDSVSPFSAGPNLWSLIFAIMCMASDLFIIRWGEGRGLNCCNRLVQPVVLLLTVDGEAWKTIFSHIFTVAQSLRSSLQTKQEEDRKWKMIWMQEVIHWNCVAPAPAVAAVENTKTFCATNQTQTLLSPASNKI